MSEPSHQVWVMDPSCDPEQSVRFTRSGDLIDASITEDREHGRFRWVLRYRANPDAPWRVYDVGYEVGLLGARIDVDHNWDRLEGSRLLMGLASAFGGAA